MIRSPGWVTGSSGGSGSHLGVTRVLQPRSKEVDPAPLAVPETDVDLPEVVTLVRSLVSHFEQY
jgi:hypothetical protein